METVPEQDKRFHPEVDRDRADKSPEKNAGRADLPGKDDRHAQIDGRFHQRPVSVVPEQAERIFEHDGGLPHPRHVKIQHDQKDDRHRKQQFRPLARPQHPQADERIEKAEQADGAEPEDPEPGEIDGEINFIGFAVALHRAEVSDAGRHAGENLRGQVVDGIGDHEIVGVDADAHEADEFGDQDVVGPVHDRPADAVHEHRPDIPENGISVSSGKPCVPVAFQIGVHSVGLYRQKEVGQKTEQDLRAEIEDEVFRLDQDDDLEDILHDAEPVLIQRADIALLVREDNVLLIGKEVGDGAVEDIQQINERQMRDSRRAGEKRDKRRERKARRGDDQPDDMIGPSVKAHQRADLPAVVFGEGLVHAEDDRGPDAELRQRQQREDPDEQVADAEVGRAEHPDENRSADKAQHVAQQLADEIHRDIFDGILTPHRNTTLFNIKNIIA